MTVVIVTVVTVTVVIFVTVVIVTYFSKNKLTPRQLMRCVQGSFSQSCNVSDDDGDDDDDDDDYDDNNDNDDNDNSKDNHKKRIYLFSLIFGGINFF